MSEAPDETTEPTEPDESPDEAKPDDEDAEQEESEQTPAQAARSHGSDEIPKKLERALTDQKKRLERIVGVSLDGKECPKCDGMGYMPEGTADEPEVVHPENLVTCEACNGYGQVVTGSRNPDHITAMCTSCAGNGFITQVAQLPPPTPIGVYTQPSSPLTAEQAQYGMMQPDGTFVPFVSGGTVA
jgi:DnaJ-class molecular chaperone